MLCRMQSLTILGKEVIQVADLYCECIYRDDRSCTAAPYYGTADCDWLVDTEECPEPMAAMACLSIVKEEDHAVERI